MGGGDSRTEPDGSFSVRIDPSGPIFHGWATQVQVDAADVRGLHVRCQVKKILHDASGPDERAAAQYTVSVGSDAYVYQGQPVSDFAPANYNPGLGASKFAVVGSEWAYVGWTSLESAYYVDHTAVSPTQPWRTMSDAELVANPPPLQ